MRLISAQYSELLGADTLVPVLEEVVLNPTWVKEVTHKSQLWTNLKRQECSMEHSERLSFFHFRAGTGPLHSKVRTR